MSYQQNYGRTGFSCPYSSCQNRSGETWTRRNWNGCGCTGTANNARRTCGCTGTANYTRNTCGCNGAANNARNTCGCTGAANYTRNTCGCAGTANYTRNTCGCTGAANNARNTCGCNEERERETTAQENRRNCDCQNQGIEWRNRGACNTCGAARNISCPLNPCATGAADKGILTGQSLAMVYSPFQNFEELYDPREGLCSGTIFNGLNKPFCPKCGC